MFVIGVCVLDKKKKAADAQLKKIVAVLLHHCHNNTEGLKK